LERHREAGIQVQRFDADAADLADQADRPRQHKAPLQEQEKHVLWGCARRVFGEGTIRPIRRIRHIRVEPLNLDARMVPYHLLNW
jgi:hypothetical protein